MGVYDRFRLAEPMGVRQYTDPGDHFFLVRRAIQRQTTNPQKKGEVTVVEFKVLESNTMKVGQVCSLVETEPSQGYFGNVLAFVAGILGYTIDEIKADPDFNKVFDGCFGPAQILTDMVVHCIAQQVKTTSPQAKTEFYTAKTWEPVDARDYARWSLAAPDGAYAGASAGDAEGAAPSNDAGAGAAA
jgi:hypothetical protein